MIIENNWKEGTQLGRPKSINLEYHPEGLSPEDVAKNRHLIVRTLTEVHGDTEQVRLLERWAGVTLGYVPIEIDLFDLCQRAEELGFNLEDNGPFPEKVEHVYRLVKIGDEQYVSRFSIYQIEGTLWALNYSWEKFARTFVGTGASLVKRPDEPNYSQKKEEGAAG